MRLPPRGRTSCAAERPMRPVWTARPGPTSTARSRSTRATPSAYRCRGELALAVRAYQDAVADLTRAVTLAPGDPDAWYYRAYAHSSLGETEAKHGDLLMAERAGHRNAATVRRGEFGDETAGDAHDLGLRAWRAGDIAAGSVHSG